MVATVCTCYIAPSDVQLPAVQLSIFIVPPVELLSYSVSRHQNCETGVSWILWSRALLLWSADTCLWCPHTQPHSGLLHHMSETQISNEDRENWRKLTRHYWTHFIVISFNETKNMYIFITWLFFPSSFGTSQLRTETNLDSRWRTENNIH